MTSRKDTEGKPAPAVFTRSNPCTKLDIWNCFRGVRGFKRVQVDEAHAVIGVNAPRNMLTNGYVTVIEKGNSEYYALTNTGVTWLSVKFKNYLRNHPASRGSAVNVPATF